MAVAPIVIRPFLWPASVCHLASESCAELLRGTLAEGNSVTFEAEQDDGVPRSLDAFACGRTASARRCSTPTRPSAHPSEQGVPCQPDIKVSGWPRNQLLATSEASSEPPTFMSLPRE